MTIGRYKTRVGLATRVPLTPPFNCEGWLGGQSGPWAFGMSLPELHVTRTGSARHHNEIYKSIKVRALNISSACRKAVWGTCSWEKIQN